VKTFLINLDRDVERLEAMHSQLSKLGIQYERFSAVRGNELPTWIKPYFLDDNGNQAPELSSGEVGCYASHLSIMRMAVETNESVLIMEDDLRLCSDLKSLVNLCLQLDVRWDMLRLSSMDKHPIVHLRSLTAVYDVVQYLKVPPNLGAYIVTPAGAQKFLAWSKPRWRPVDQDLRRPWENNINTIGLYPNPVTQNHHASSIDSIGNRKRGRTKYTRDSRFRDRLMRLTYNFKMLGIRRTLHALLLPASKTSPI
jgi:glycosyl transferase family 25